MNYLIGIDGGGTKTESVLCLESGEVVARYVTAGTNAFDIGMPEAQRRILDCINRLLSQVPLGGKAASCYAGLAACIDYFPHEMEDFLNSRTSFDHLRLEGDGGSLIAAMQGHSDGASLIAGTGSSLYIRSNDVLKRFGGWSPLIDTEGSGYKLGLHAFYSAFRSFDGRGPKTILYDLIAEQMGKKPDENLPMIIARGRPYIASFARVVFEGRKLGDSAATEIFNHGVKCLSELIEIASHQIDGSFNVFTSGGLFDAFPEYLEAVREAAPTQATLIKLDTKPIYGAVVEALWDMGLSPSPQFKNNFISSYSEICRT